MSVRCAIYASLVCLLIGASAMPGGTSHSMAIAVPMVACGSLQTVSRIAGADAPKQGEVRIVPATETSRLALRSGAGNGVGPVCAVVDNRCRRLYVLNQGTHNISVVDLVHRHVVAVVPIRVMQAYSFGRFQNVRMLVNTRANRLYVIGADLLRTDVGRHESYETHNNSIVAISTVTLRPTADHSEADVHYSDAAVDDSRDEVYVATECIDRSGQRWSDWRIVVLDGKSLKASRVLAVQNSVDAVALARRGRTLLTLEHTLRHDQGGGRDTCLVARSPDTGHEIGRSAPYPGFCGHGGLAVDDPRRTVMFGLFHQPDVYNVHLVDSTTLKPIKAWNSSSTDGILSDDYITDAQHRRVFFTVQRSVAALDLTHPGKAPGRDVVS